MQADPVSQPGTIAVAAVDCLHGVGKARSRARVACDRLLVELAHSHAGHNDWTVQHRAGASPLLHNRSKHSKLVASIAHSGNWIAAGIALGADIGVDVQEHGNTTRQQEIARFLDLDANVCGSSFFDAWVLREAIAKATSTSVLEKQSIESGLAPACHRQGETVFAADCGALVTPVGPDVSFAFVVHYHKVTQHCA